MRKRTEEETHRGGNAPRAYPPMSDDAGNVEAMAFQLILSELQEQKQALRQIPPLLKKVIDQLEAQAKPQAPPKIADYDEMYEDKRKPGWYRVPGKPPPSQQAEEE